MTIRKKKNFCDTNVCMKTKKSEKLTVLYICHDLGSGGAAQSLINMIRSVSYEVIPIVLFRKRSVMSLKIEQLGYMVLYHNFSLNISNPNRLFAFCIYPLRLIHDYIVNRNCVKWVLKQTEGIHVDIVHSNSCVVSFGGDLAKKLCSKHVWHVREFMDLDHGLRPVCSFTTLERKISKADATIAITKAIFDKWRLLSCSNSYVIYNAVRSVSDCTYVPEKEKYVLFCSAVLSDNKGADSATEIYCRSKIYDKKYRLYYVGKYTEEYKDKLLGIAREYGQEDGLVFLGHQNDIKQYMSKASAFMMCSKFEALGRVTVEAMFYGCPILGHNTGGTKEVVIHDSTGLLYDTIEEAVVMLQRLIDDKALSERLVCKAIEDAKTRFSEEEYGIKIINVYRQVLK